ncbi:MAG: glucoamylase family protein, partial [Trueperaceae bacterium]|nr:glucoamylase family protein [Trueperaceae bacterium]
MPEWVRRLPWTCVRAAEATPPGVGYHDREVLYAGPLFIHQYSHLWIDFRGIQDTFMRTKGSDYFENSRRATLIQQAYAIRNPLRFAEYGDCCWGLTASNGPGPTTKVIDGTERHFLGYAARGAPNGPDDGTIAPWCAAASLPFAPEVVLTHAQPFSRPSRRRPQPLRPRVHLQPHVPHDRQRPRRLGL